MKKISFLAIATLVLASTLFAAETIPPIGVFAEKGNIYYSPDGLHKNQLTKSGKDRTPVLSPDKCKVVFIRKSNKEAYSPTGTGEEGAADKLADQLWSIDINGNNEKILVHDNDPDIEKGYDKWAGEDVVGFIEDESVQFSPDGKTIYYLTPAWVTSSALRGVNIDGSNGRFIAGANYLKVIDKGGYKGHLIINQHRYFVAGGSYDWYFVFTPDGKEVGPLGDDLERVDWDFLYSDFINSKM